MRSACSCTMQRALLTGIRTAAGACWIAHLPPCHVQGLSKAPDVLRTACVKGYGPQRTVYTSTATSAVGTSGSNFDFDLFAIGAGSAGVQACKVASSRYGAKTGVCEFPHLSFVPDDTSKGGIGGTCIIRGCVPSKLIWYCAEFPAAFEECKAYGWHIPGKPTFDWQAFIRGKRRELQRLSDAYKQQLDNNNVTLIPGRGCVTGPQEVEVAGKKYRARNILIATGSIPVEPANLPGIELCIDSNDIIDLEKFPDKMVVIGGGYIGVEYGCMFKRIGAEVHMMVRGDKPMKGFDEETRDFLCSQLPVVGLQMHGHTTVQRISKQPDGRLTVTYKQEDTDETQEIQDVDQVLVDVGRRARTSNLGLEEVGVQIGEAGAIITDEYNRTAVPTIWAAGDVVDRASLTPVAMMEGAAIAETLFGAKPTKPDYWAIPGAVSSIPNLATTGLTEEAAVEKLRDVDIYTRTFRPMKACLSGILPDRTFIKVVVASRTGQVVGLHMVGEDAAEILQGFAVAAKIGLTKQQLDSVVSIHPTSSEELTSLREAKRRYLNGKLLGSPGGSG